MRPMLAAMFSGLALATASCAATRAPTRTSDVTITSAAFEPSAYTHVCAAPELQSALDLLQEDLARTDPGIALTVVFAPSGCTAADVWSGAVDIAITDVDASAEAESRVIDRPFAVAGLAFIANRGSTTSGMSSISFEEMRRLFAGEIASWKELGGSSHRVFAMHRSGGAAQRVFRENMPWATSRSPASDLRSDAYVSAIASREGTIGYAMLTELTSGSDVRTLSIRTPRGVIAPSARNIANSTYPFRTYVHLYTHGKDTATQLVLERVMTGPFQDRVAGLRGLVPMKAIVDAR